MPEVLHSYESEALLKELQKRLNVTGDYIQTRTIFGDLIDFWKTQANSLRTLNITGHAPVEFNTKWLIYADGTHTKLVGLLTKINWQFVGELDLCVARLFRFTMQDEVKAQAWDHLRKYITTEHFRGKPRIGLSLPASAFQSLGSTQQPRSGPYREDVAKALTALLEGIVQQALAKGSPQAVEALAAAMDKAEAAFGPRKPAEDHVFCIFDVLPETKLVLEQAADRGNGKFSDRVTALILQKLHIDELPGMQGAR
ncbi:hypothetical protein [Prosthecobacter vanneervenii]|uniref:Uncharacterized protein n=1 Tax=Prosthecobacter vanneervenii TaxID=48466 RepID=A0A7W7Y8Q2_9BACT|nr:hypothetical protein [Prosthecobacter vanneervenii]MBB5031482.1 hypothetical protein [Prosthecobacter vanneervenii]